MVFVETPTRGKIVYLISFFQRLHLIWLIMSFTIQVGRSLLYFEHPILKWKFSLSKELKIWKLIGGKKYTSGILIETYIKSMELSATKFCRRLHSWMVEYNTWFFSYFGTIYILLFVQLFIISHNQFLCSVNWKETFYLYFDSIEMIRYILLQAIF
jgi:hypothetical protein